VPGDRQKPEFTGHFKIHISAMTCGYYRTSSAVTALPMIMRWISDVPSKIVKVLEVRAVSAGRSGVRLPLVSTNSAPALHSKSPIWGSVGSLCTRQTRAPPSLNEGAHIP
jgi:hypothetical protein